MSYTRSFCEGIIKSKQKGWIKGNVIELGNNKFHTAQIEPYLKAIDPSIMTCKGAQQLWLQAGAQSYVVVEDEADVPDIKYDVVVNQAWLEERFDVCEVLRKTHSTLKVGGFMFTNLPIGLSVGYHSYTLNFWQKFCKDNNYEVRYCQVSDEMGNYPILVSMASPYTFTKLKDVLYKFRETWNLRMTIVIQKKDDNELKLK